MRDGRGRNVVKAKKTAVVKSKKRVFDKHFKVDEAKVAFTSYKGDTVEATLLVFERGDSAACILHETDTDTIILTEQFRFPTFEKGPGWLVETPAGSVDPGESPADCIRREMMEEIGYKLGKLKPIAKFYVSPGGSSERIHLFYAPVTSAALVDKAASGLTGHQEDVKRVRMSRAAFLEGWRKGKFEDAKLLVGAGWLAANVA
jgi:ADP-ribose pyrophosphatase